MSITTKEIREQLSNILQSAQMSTNPLIQQALMEEKAFRKRTEVEIDYTLRTARGIVVEYNPPEIKKKTLDKLTLDLELANSLQEVLKPYSPINNDPKWQCHFPLKYNKMDLILKGAKEFLEKGENFIDLFYDQKIPNGYLYDTADSEITILGPNEDKIYGDSKNSFLKAALLETYLISEDINKKKTLSELELMGKERTGMWIDSTAMAHVVPFPDSLNLSALDPRFERFTYSYSDTKTPKGLLFVHSGYTFGGDRKKVRGDKPYAPEDCSSWLEKICKSPESITTADQLYYHRRVLQDGVVTKEWSDSPTPKIMDRLFEVVSHWQQDPQKYIQPGQIYCHRSFNKKEDPNMDQTPGSGGHTTLVLGFKSDIKESKIVTIGYHRDMPTEEGFGIQQFPLESENKKIMMFSVKGKEAKSATVQNIPEVVTKTTSSQYNKNQM